MRRSLVLLAPLAAALAACNDPGDVGCPAEAIPAIVLAVRDAASNANITPLATAIATDGAFSDSLVTYSRASAAEGFAPISKVLWQRPGTYHLRVIAPGYAAWERSGLRVRRLTCSVTTVTLEARLQPAS